MHGFIIPTLKQHKYLIEFNKQKITKMKEAQCINNAGTSDNISPEKPASPKQLSQQSNASQNQSDIESNMSNQILLSDSNKLECINSSALN